MKSIRCGVVGVGYLGKFHAEKYFQLDNAKLVATVDTNLDSAQTLAHQYQCQAVQDYKTLVDKIDCVSIVTPTQSHYDIAKFFLENNIHVLLEKPMTVNLEQADGLIQLANKNKLILQIGHLERFNPVLLAIQDQLGQPTFIESHRIAPFTQRGADVNVVLDLMIHDLDLIQCMVKSPITSIDAQGVPVLSNTIDIANARIHFENKCVANLTASRVSNKTERKMRVFQNDKYLSLDFHQKAYSIYQKGTKLDEHGVPEILFNQSQVNNNDAIKTEIIEFISAIQNNTQPIVSGYDGKAALQTAIRITQALTEYNQ